MSRDGNCACKLDGLYLERARMGRIFFCATLPTVVIPPVLFVLAATSMMTISVLKQPLQSTPTLATRFRPSEHPVTVGRLAWRICW